MRERAAAHSATRLWDGLVRAFGLMEVQKEMFPTPDGYLEGTARDSEVLNAVRKATPESQAKLEERFAP